MKSLFTNRAAARAGFRRGVTLVELLVSITLVGILAAIGIANLKDVSSGARQETDIDTGNLLNRAVLHYGQSSAEIAIAAGSDSSDELSVIALLQARDPQLPGSPYLPADMSFSTSSSTDVVRYEWTGAFFRVLPEGAAGAGITVD
jgi:prepilin-type N-terminal cleavage/methylation domain-containing protein